jgi:hypothetical protein
MWGGHRRRWSDEDGAAAARGEVVAARGRRIGKKKIEPSWLYKD